MPQEFLNGPLILSCQSMDTLPPVGCDLLEQKVFELGCILQETLQLRIRNAELQRLDAMMLQRDQQMIRFLSQFHPNI